MNRIRLYNKRHQVITSSNEKYNSFEMMLGSWTDSELSNFEVREFENYAEAAEEALQYPDINWIQLHEYHKDIFHALKQEIKAVIKNTKMTVHFDSILMDPDEIKNTMFDRVIQFQDNSEDTFRPLFDMNDIINFKITNPWFDNLAEMEKHLIKSPCLRIFQRFEKFKIIHLIGRTSVGTTYEIVLCPDLIDNLGQWRKKASVVQQSNLPKYLITILRLQQQIDSSFRLR